MDYQQRATNLLTILLIVEPLLYQRSSAAPIQLSRYFFKRYEGTQQDSTVD